MFGVAAEFAALVPPSLFAPSNGTHDAARANSNGRPAAKNAPETPATPNAAATANANHGAASNGGGRSQKLEGVDY